MHARGESASAFDRGWYRSDGARTQNKNTFTGVNGQGFHTTYFAFDLTDVSTIITSAALRVRILNYHSLDTSEPYVVYDVTNSVNVVTNLAIPSPDAMRVFQDLQSGIAYASGNIHESNLLQTIDIPLSGGAVSDLNNAIGNRFALGFHLTDVEFVGGNANGISFFSNVGELLLEGPSISLVSIDSGPTVKWDSDSALAYRVEVSSNLVAGGWTPLSSSITGTGTRMSIADTNGLTPPHRFYQIKAWLRE